MPKKGSICRGKRKKGNWYALPKELVALIVSHHHDATEFLRSRLVCRRWDMDIPLRVNLPLQPPILMLPSHAFIGPYYFLNTSAVRHLLTSETTRHAHCFGSSIGWLFLLASSPTVSLFNAITNQEIRLPDLNTIPSHILSTQRTAQTTFLIESTIVAGRKEVFNLAVISSDPVEDPNFVAFISLAHFDKQFFYCRGNNARSWTAIRNPFPDFVLRDVNNQPEHRRLYAISSDNRRLLVFHFDASPRATPYSLAGVPESDFTYLAETPAGQMIIVTKDLAPKVAVEAAVFGVYLLEIDPNNQQASATFIEGLGQYAVFVGPGQSICIDARRFPSFHANSIYYLFEYEEEVKGMMVKRENIARFSLVMEYPVSIYKLNQLPTTNSTRNERQCWWISPNLRQ